eukprot:TRINITY_DN7583_c0_g1_i2.p1 TRINITY_DN7583_c0_g1~~TRINITY_DN7583_c0_g1_i2.p1  ORF type:complete len:425 (-),score=49.59 TRINITY_DN7583_c0_g1_i2:33-1307(-)
MFMAPCEKKNVILSLLILLLCAADAYRSSRKVSLKMKISSRSTSPRSRSSSSSPSRTASRSKLTSPPMRSWLDHYKRPEKIGDGSYGKVYLVEKIGDPSTKKVIKRVTHEKYKQIEEEVMNLKLPFVADLEDKFIDTKAVSLLTRYYEGGDLLHHMSQAGTLEPAKVRFWGSQMAYALWQLHRNQVLYADMKLENTLITNGNVVLTDFGMSTRPCPSELGWACETKAKGTPIYVTPSILEHGPYGYEVDWWALGVTLFILQEGKMVFPGKETHHVLRSIKRRDLNLQKVSAKPTSPLIQFLDAKILNFEAFNHLENDQARQRMVDKASKHPILSHPYWHNLIDAETIDRFWYDVCRNHSIHKENCEKVTGPPSWAKDVVEASADDSMSGSDSDSDSEDDSETDLECEGVACKFIPSVLTRWMKS